MSTKAELEAKIKDQHDQLIKAGVIKPITMMSKIKDREATCTEDIKILITECEKETGRKYISSLAYGTALHKAIEDALINGTGIIEMPSWNTL